MLTSLSSPPSRDVARRSYTLKHKRKMVRDVEMLLNSGSNIRSACISMRLDRSLFYKWKKSLCVNNNVAGGSHDANHVSVASDTLGGTLTEENQIVVCDMPIDNPVGDEPMNDVVVPLNDVTVAACNMPLTDVTPVTTAIIMLPTRKFFSGNLRSLHPGKSSILASKTTPLLRWIFEHREQGVQVTTRMVRKVAEDIVPNFREKTIVAKNQVVRRFLHRVGLTHRVATHVAQKSHHETEAASIEFMEFMRRKVANMNPDHVINMDQTPIPFSYHNNRTWNKKGMRTIHVRASTTETKRATLAATVTMSGQLLVPLLIFKGAANGRIAKKELTTFAPMAVYAVQKKAWMDESMMRLWIAKCLSPWKNTLPQNCVPLLILDSFRVHMMGPIVAEIQGLGIEVQYIPGGCTYLCQPIDVGVNRPIKHAMAEQWEDWIDSEGVQNGNVMATPPRELIATWVVEAYWTLKTETCKKAWTKKGFEWTV